MLCYREAFELEKQKRELEKEGVYLSSECGKFGFVVRRVYEWRNMKC